MLNDGFLTIQKHSFFLSIIPINNLKQQKPLAIARGLSSHKAPNVELFFFIISIIRCCLLFNYSSSCTAFLGSLL